MVVVVWEMVATGYKEPAVVAAFIGGKLLVYRIPWDETLKELFQLLVQKAEVFWGYVERQEPPPADGTMAAAKWIKKFYAEQRGVELVKVERDHEKYHQLNGAVMLYHAAQREMKLLKERQAQASAIIQEYIKDGAGLESDGFKVTWKQDKRGRIDYKKALAELYGEVPKDTIEGFRMQPPRKFLVKLKENEDG